ncbi:hypothetical protein [Actinorhabdospora filicis]|nr:hypothetical protein [Actinorhabdospora filicis]
MRGEDGGDDFRSALLLRLDPETIRVWPGDTRAVSAWEQLRLWGWRVMSDPDGGGILDLFAWGLMVEQGSHGGDRLMTLRRPGDVLWNGAVPLPAGWLANVIARKGRLVPAYAVPDSPAVQQPGLLADRVRKAADNQRLLGGRIPIR